MCPSHLYIHIPFCQVRCAYCDFYSTAGRIDLAPGYVESLLAELECAEIGEAALDTVYLGGGTPTLIGTDLLKEIMVALRVRLRPDAEVTVEANPSTVTAGLAAGLKQAGVNRVSLGVQSFDTRMRRNLGRAGDKRDVFRAMEALRGAGFENVGVDLMFAIPGQGARELESDIRQVQLLDPEHVSWYELTVRDGSAYSKRWREELEIAREHGPEFYHIVAGALEDAGYRWYETSNYALPGRECRHNLAYWRGEDYIGLGSGAWSTVGLERWRNAEDIDSYIQGKDVRDGLRHRERLEKKEKMMEKLDLGLRLDSGLPRNGVAGLLDTDEERLLVESGFLVCEGDKIYLTRAGRFVANEISARLLRD